MEKHISKADQSDHGKDDELQDEALFAAHAPAFPFSATFAEMLFSLLHFHSSILPITIR